MDTLTIRDRLRAWWYRDDEIDAYINANRAKLRPGMEAPDQRIIDELGRAVWVRVDRAERRLRPES